MKEQSAANRDRRVGRSLSAGIGSFVQIEFEINRGRLNVISANAELTRRDYAD
jgi:hypothetical protein